ncbi:MAG: hypothetical protein EON85_07295, partial [Brevundimonas sp.]
LIGRYNSTLRLLLNTGGEETPTFVESLGGAFTITTIAFGSSGAPSMADVDGDGDLDSLVGLGNGALGFSQVVGRRSADPAVVITVTAENDRPAVSNLPLDLTVTEDVESNLNLSALTLRDGDLTDVLTVVLTATAGTLTSATAGGVTVAGSGTSGLTLTGTAAAIDAFLNTAASIRYLALPNVSGGNVASLTITADDGSGPIQLGTVNIDVTPVNDSPGLSAFDATIDFVSNGAGVEPGLLDADVIFVDADDAFEGGALTVNGLLAEDRVSVRDQGAGPGQIGLSGSLVSFGGVVIGTLSGGIGGNLTVTFNAAATSAAVEALIENLTYANVSATPTETRTLVLNVVDAAGADLVSFTATAGAANPLDAVNVGSYAAPTMADVDGDGDLDVVVGSYGGGFRYLENTGSATAPVFEERSGAANPLDGVYGGSRSQISFADLDGDGDLDVVSGGGYGSPNYYENVGTSTAPVYEGRSGSEVPFNLDVFDGANVPVFADLDGDGDLDAVSSPSYGDLRYFENTGSATAAVFERREDDDNPFNALNLGRNARASFADLDQDGDLDVVIGSSSGEVIYFENLSTPGLLDLARRTGGDNPLGGLETDLSLAFGDLNGDGVPDLVFGDGSELRYVQSVTSGSRAIVVTVTPLDGSINGDADDNALVGTADAETINGLGGDDTLSGQGGADTMDGGEGDDTVDYSGAAAGVNAQLNRALALSDGDGAADVFISIENLTGSAFNDLLIGSDDANVLAGGLGGDILLGLGGNDVLIGGTGMANTLQGGLGDDTYVINQNDTITEFSGEGVDTVQTDTASYVLRTHLENLTYTGSGSFIASGNSVANVLTGGELNDILQGLAGDDTLIGRGGYDILQGGNGTDTVDYSGAAAGVSVRLAANITLNDGNGSTDNLSGIENVTGSAFSDLIFGDAGANVLNGGLGG